MASVGLPASFILFTADETETGGPEGGGAPVREAVRIGYGTEGEGAYYVDCATGTIDYIEEHTFSVLHVSDSPRSFARCLAAFEGATSGTTLDTSPEEWTDIAESLERTIAEIDPSALREDPGFWHSLLFDVSSGDYVGEESGDA
ncbi:SUKH-4 family immunity protein [Streptomyces sp. NPDC096132]|uniref:SUKH-4 family immunity protein n=1 Tax=Streptomyces sp. NPDC096132 TaxID=3366075 RepID=UPI003814C1A1